MAKAATSYMPTTTAVVTRKVDNLVWAGFDTRPQAMTFYVKFIELGGGLISTARIFGIRSTSNPYLTLSTTAAGDLKYRMVHGSATGNVESVTSVAASVGDTVELVGQIDAGGKVTLIHAFNGASGTSNTQSGARQLPAAWWSAQLALGHNGAGAGVGIWAFLNAAVHRGVQSLAFMRRVAGVS